MPHDPRLPFFPDKDNQNQSPKDQEITREESRGKNGFIVWLSNLKLWQKILLGIVLVAVTHGWILVALSVWLGYKLYTASHSVLITVFVSILMCIITLPIALMEWDTEETNKKSITTGSKVASEKKTDKAAENGDSKVPKESPKVIVSEKSKPKRQGSNGIVKQITDGDTLVLTSGVKVRLVQIDTPEKFGAKECHSDQSSARLNSMIPPGTKVFLEVDPRLDASDSYGRKLRYVWKGKVNINVRMVAVGSASAWFYKGQKGKYATQLYKAVQTAKSQKRGLWGACPKSVLNVNQGLSTGLIIKPKPKPKHKPVSPSNNSGNCDPNYTGACLKQGAGDYDCKGGTGNGPNFIAGPIQIVGSDVHDLNRDDDNIACD